MNASRRTFLQTLGALPLISALSRRAGASTPVPPPPPVRRLLLNRFSIAGFQYYDGLALLHRIRKRDGAVFKTGCGSSGGNPEEIARRMTVDIAPRSLHPGCRLNLKAEPSNPHDPFAVEIYFDKIKLGYVPRSDNKHISRLLDQGAKLDCLVIEVDPDAGAWNMVKVEVALL